MRFRKLDLNLLVVLDAMLKFRSTSRAGEHLSLSQPAVSNALRRLRDHFGDELFVPLDRQMMPTSLASSLEEPVRDLLIQLQVVADKRPVFDPKTSDRTFSIIASDYVAQVFLSPLLQHLAVEAPGTSLDLRIITETAEDTLRHGEVDFLVFPEHALVDGHPRRRLFGEDFTCIAWAGNKEVGEELGLKDFMRLRHVVTAYARPSQIQLAFARLSQEVDVACRVPSFSQVPMFVVGTPYIATIHSRLVPQIPGDLPLRFFRPPVPIPLLYENAQWHRHRNSDPDTQWMVHEMMKVAESLPPLEDIGDQRASAR